MRMRTTHTCSNTDNYSSHSTLTLPSITNEVHYEHASMPTRIFCESLRELHKRNFVRVCYTQLHDGMTVEMSDFSKAIECCQEFITDVRLSLFHSLTHLD